jgi:hypothetical protein
VLIQVRGGNNISQVVFAECELSAPDSGTAYTGPGISLDAGTNASDVLDQVRFVSCYSSLIRQPYDCPARATRRCRDRSARRRGRAASGRPSCGRSPRRLIYVDSSSANARATAASGVSAAPSALKRASSSAARVSRRNAVRRSYVIVSVNSRGNPCRANAAPA